MPVDLLVYLHLFILRGLLLMLLGRSLGLTFFLTLVFLETVPEVTITRGL
jgi:hypothetical protein